MELSDSHKRTFGAALKAIHSAQLPPELKRKDSAGDFSLKYRESMKSFQAQVENQTFDEPVAAKLAKFIKSKRDEINHLIERAENLLPNFNPSHWNSSSVTRTFTAATC
jgi:spectinomycin phosphotransferase